MKPRNKYERNIMQLHYKLPAITEKQKQWAFEHCFPPVGYSTNKSVWCLHCGEVFTRSTSELIVSLVGDEAVCPKCGSKLKLKNSRKAKYNESWYFTIITAIQGFQVCRNFIVEKKMFRSIDGLREPNYTINEAVQNWIDENGIETIVARPCKPMMLYNDAWDFSKPMEIRQRRFSYYSQDKYDIDAKYVYPYTNILPKVKRNGFSLRFKEFSYSELIKLLLKDKEAEILIKNKQYKLLGYKKYRGIKQMPFAQSIKICNRNRYTVQDASMWIDYIKLLDYFHLDTHNAHYVCPRNLEEAHDRLLTRKQRIEDKIEYEKKMAKAKKWEAEYQESKGKFFGICFGNEDIIITVIQSVAEMAEEGKAMHHCVFDMEYYKKKNSLILSAKDKKGKRIETIELDLKTFKVVQSRGVCNKNTARHNEIISLVNKNIRLIKEAV